MKQSEKNGTTPRVTRRNNAKSDAHGEDLLDSFCREWGV